MSKIEIGYFTTYKLIAANESVIPGIYKPAKPKHLPSSRGNFVNICDQTWLMYLGDTGMPVVLYVRIQSINCSTVNAI